MDKLFQFDVERNGVTAWKAGEKGTVVTGETCYGPQYAAYHKADI